MIRDTGLIREKLPDASVTGRASGSRAGHPHDAPHSRPLHIADRLANVFFRELQAMTDVAAALRESGTAAFTEF